MKRASITIITLISLLFTSQGQAFWVWTPETNKWVNPKYAVKDTPSEQLKFALEFYAEGQFKEAIREFQKLIKHYPRAREAPEAQYFIGTAFEEQNKFSEAFKQYQMVVDKYPFSERSADIVKKQYEIALKLIDGEKSKSGIMHSLSGGGNMQIIEILRAVIKNAPYGELAPVAQYKIGLYLLENQVYLEARDEFEKVVNDFPDSEWAKAAKYQIAVADSKRSTDPAYDQKITQAAIAEFKDFVEDNPEAELSEKAKEEIGRLREKEAENAFLVAKFYEKQKNYQAAKLYYERVVDEYWDSSWSSKAMEKIREMSIKIK